MPSGGAGDGVGGQLAQQVEHPVGAVDDDVGERHQGRLLVGRGSRPAASAGRCSRSAATASKASTSPRSSPAKRKPPASSSSARGSARRGPCACRPSGPRSRCGPARRPGRGGAASSRIGGSSRSNAAVGVRQPPGVHGDREPLLLDVGVAGVGAPQQRRAARARRWTARAGGAGEIDPAAGRGPALVAVLAEDEAAPCRGRRSRRRPRRGRRGPAPGGPGGPVTTATARTTSLSVDEHLGRVGVDVRLRRVVDDRREGAVEVEADDDLRRRARTRASYRCSASGEVNSMAASQPRPVETGQPVRSVEAAGPVRRRRR